MPDAPAPADLSRSDPRPSTAQREVFRCAAIRDREEGVEAVTCRIVEVLGDGFDFLAFNSLFRVDLQSATQPGHVRHAAKVPLPRGHAFAALKGAAMPGAPAG
ncbi:MAG: hypothetical protein OXQ28_01570 [Acidobacteriota bacterium]|nr:hypothetical protein [Acidobacteriota bacterium]